DGPYRFVGHHGRGRIVSADAFEGAVDLGEGVLHLLPALAYLEALTHADDRCDAGSQGRFGLGGDQSVVLTMLRAALGVPHDGVLHPQPGQHRSGDLAGVGTRGVRRNVLGAVSDGQFVRIHQGLHRAQVGERRADRHFHRRIVVLGVLEAPGQFLHQVRGLEMVQVHLPVPRHQRGAARGHVFVAFQSVSTSIPGRVLPSRNSRDAPPPVEIWLKPASSKPSRRTAAAEAASVRPWATALVPAANASNSKTPIGPFHTTVLAETISWPKACPESGPMSRPIWSSGISSTGTTVAGASPENSGATTTSVGSTICTPRSAAVAK